MPQVQEVWNKLNPRERLTAIGALVVGLGWIIGLAGSFGLGGNTIALVGAIVVLVILFLKYSPNQSVTWPAPIPTIVLAISAIVALLALIGLLQWLSLGGLSYFGAAIIAAIVTAVGAALMAWGAWQEYQVTKSAVGSSPTSVPPASPPPAPTPTTPPPSASDTDDLPPA